MPRIEIEPNQQAMVALLERGDGTPTIDVCKQCLYFFEEGSASPLYLQKRFPKSGVGSTDVEHPPYEDDYYMCDCCGDRLTTVNAG